MASQSFESTTKNASSTYHAINNPVLLSLCPKSARLFFHFFCRKYRENNLVSFFNVIVMIHKFDCMHTGTYINESVRFNSSFGNNIEMIIWFLFLLYCCDFYVPVCVRGVG